MSAFPDLSAQTGAPLEWWYLHGVLDQPARRRHFMVALFRGPCAPGAAEAPAMAFITLHDLAAGSRQVRSIISQGMVATFDQVLRAVTARQAPASLIELCLDAFRRRALDREGLSFTTDGVALGAGPFSADFAAIRLDQEAECLRLRFTTGGEAFDLRLSPDAAWSDLSSADLPPGLGIAGYRSCPRLMILGLAGAEAATGRAWIDHQWGELSQIAAAPRGRLKLMGWEWFSLLLDDGTALLLYQPRNQLTRRVERPFAVAYGDFGWRKLSGAFTARPVHIHRSPVTGHRYPTVWSIKVPELDLDLTLGALTEAGEVPVYGPMDCNWQTPAEVAGSRAGRPVSGEAWLELNGYGYPLTIPAQWRFWMRYLGQVRRAGKAS